MNKDYFIRADNGAGHVVTVPMTRKELSDMLNWSVALGALASMAIEGEGLPGVAPDDLVKVMPEVPEKLLKTED